MVIGSIDKSESMRKIKLQEKALKTITLKAKHKLEYLEEKQSCSLEVSDAEFSETDLELQSIQSDSTFEIISRKRINSDMKLAGISQSKQMRVELPSVALACDRTGVSDRSTLL